MVDENLIWTWKTDHTKIVHDKICCNCSEDLIERRIFPGEEKAYQIDKDESKMEDQKDEEEDDEEIPPKRNRVV